MDRTEYDQKMLNMLEDTSTYKLLPNDPAKSTEAKIKTILSSMKERISEEVYKELNVTDGTTPRIYGTPKIHKEGTPLSPIVSYIGSPTYQLSKYLVAILSPLVGNNHHHLRSKDWSDLTQQLVLKRDEELVSFDVVALFTSIPTSIAVDAAKSRLDQDDNLKERTMLTPTEISSLMSFCLNATEFSFKGKLYKHIHGTAIGSPISVVVANLVMEVLEVRTLETFIDPPRINNRYVDVTICVIRREYIEVSVYRKKTHTVRYLQFSSHHPSKHKAAVVRTLYHRAENLLSFEKNVDNERTHIQRALLDNGYPRQFIKKFIKQSSKKEQLSGEETKGYVTLPYVQGVTEIQRVLQSYNVKVSIRPASTLRKILSSKIEDPLPKEKKTGVIYSNPCGDCDTEYIGETKRSVGTRIKEHQASDRLQKTERSALSEHALRSGHSIAWQDANILETEGRWHQRKWAEACYISRNKNTIFRDSSRKLPDNYISLLN